MSNVEKSIEITDAKIKFVSLVDKAANKKSFLLTKQEDGQQGFQTNGRIVKVDAESHYVTGVVYEPMVADAHDNFMTEAEIEKAAHWFMKNGDKIDLQHSFEEADGLTVVESSVTKADQTIGDQEIKKGTWLMTVEVANDDVWQAIEKGEITGLSMGGVGNYATKDVQLDDVAKAEESADDTVPEKLNLLERIAKMMGIESAVVKGEVRDRYEQRVRAESFWTAWDSLNSVLRHYNYWSDEVEYEQDEAKIRDALADFSEIITELCKGENIAKALHDAQPKEEDSAESGKEEGEVEKAGRKMSRANKDKLNSIAQQLIDFTKEFDDDEPDAAQGAEDDADKNDEKEEIDMNKDEIQKMIDEAVQKAMTPSEQPAEQPVEKADELTTETVQKMIDEAVEKAVKPVEKEEEQSAESNAMTAEAVQKMIEETVSKAFKQRGLSTSVDDGTDKPVEKGEQHHYLHGIL